jgi:hypothetical protein
MLIKKLLFVCGGDRTQAASLKHKSFNSTLQQKRALSFSGIESPDLYTVTRSATLPRFFTFKTFLLETETSNGILWSDIFVLFLVKDFVVIIRTSGI